MTCTYIGVDARELFIDHLRCFAMFWGQRTDTIFHSFGKCLLLPLFPKSQLSSCGDLITR